MPDFFKQCSKTAQLGQQGESAVVNLLEQRGYTILARNFRTKYGEVDVIARHQEVIAFVEVKCRKNHYFALSAVVTRSKQQKIARAARIFIAQHSNILCSYRFDVALVEEDFNVVYIEHAFTVDES